MSKGRTKNNIKGIYGLTGSMEGQLYTIMLLSNLLICLYSLLATIAAKNISPIYIFTGGILVLLILIAFMVYRKKTFKIGYILQCIVMNVLFLPVMFIFYGGLHSGMPIFMILAFIVCACNPERRAAYLSLVVTTVLYMMLIGLSLWKPDLIQPVKSENMVINIIAAITVSSCVCVALITFYLKLYKDLYAKNTLDYEQKAQMRMALLEAQVENIDDIKRQRYNMRHHNQIIGEFAARHDIKGLRNYLLEKQYSDEFYSKRLYCLNVEINNILTIYDRIARNKNVELEVNADVKSEVEMDTSELMNMISTILENAITGAVDSGLEGKKVCVEMKERGRRLVMNCRNTCRKGLKEMSEYPGFPGNGIIAIGNRLETIGGILDYSIENDEVVCRLIVDAF